MVDFHTAWRRPVMVTMRKILRASCLVLVFLGACSEAPPPGGAALLEGHGLETVTVEMASVARETAFDGVVEAVNQSTVSAQTAGRVVDMPVDVGDEVLDAIEVSLARGEFWVFPGKGTRFGYIMRRLFPGLVWKDCHKKEGF